MEDKKRLRVTIIDPEPLFYVNGKNGKLLEL
jgi:hypothetical protein